MESGHFNVEIARISQDKILEDGSKSSNRFKNKGLGRLD
jgi:hypothetical protein